MQKITIMLFLPIFLFLSVESTLAQTPPKFWIRSLEGKRFDSRKEKSPLVISFFFVNCVPCIKEIPDLYKDSLGTISKKFFKEKMSFPTIVGIKGKEYLFRFKGIDQTQLEKIKLLL